jgi:hypothetical protein
MRYIKNLFRKPAFSVLVFIVCLVLFSWPLLSIVGSNPKNMFLYLFFVWGVVILLLFFMNRSYRSSDTEEESPPDNGDNDV